jgi:hypothetical protein
MTAPFIPLCGQDPHCTTQENKDFIHGNGRDRNSNSSDFNGFAPPSIHMRLGHGLSNVSRSRMLFSADMDSTDDLNEGVQLASFCSETDIYSLLSMPSKNQAQNPANSSQATNSL